MSLVTDDSLLFFNHKFRGSSTYDGGQLIAEATVTMNGFQIKAVMRRGKGFTELLSVEVASGTKGYGVQEHHGDIILM